MSTAEQRPAAIDKWLNEVYPEIRERAVREGAVILWSDEKGLRDRGQP
jgi:hypothetical protein